MDFYPLAGMAEGTALNLSKFLADTDYGIDFNGISKTANKQAIVFRGAYAGEGTNPGWQLQDAIKPPNTPPPPPPPPANPVLSSLQCSPSSIITGQSTTCTVSITAAVSTAASVTLSSNNTTALSASAAVTIPAGSTSVPFAASAGPVSTQVSVTLTAALNGSAVSAAVSVNPLTSTPPPPASFYLRADNTELSGSTNGPIVSPATAPSGLTGNLVVKGSGSVNFAAGQAGNGVYFVNCCTNSNNAYYKFTGAPVGSIFNTAQGQVTFFLKSRYNLAQRATATSYRSVFDVRDDNAGNHLYGFSTTVMSGRLVFNYVVGGVSKYYYVPQGTEDALFGAGKTIAIAIEWESGVSKFYLNNVLMQSSSYSPPISNWTARSNFDIGAYEYLTYGGYDSCDDIIDEFIVGPPTL